MRYRHGRRKVQFEGGDRGMADLGMVLVGFMMITIPMMTLSSRQFLTVELPRVAGGERAETVADIEVGLDAQGRYFLDGRRVDEAELRAGIANKKRVCLRAHRDTPVEKYLKVIAVLKDAGVKEYAADISNTRSLK